MKLWKKRWFVLSDLCLFYYRGESCPLSSCFIRVALIKTIVGCRSLVQSAVLWPSLPQAVLSVICDIYLDPSPCGKQPVRTSWGDILIEIGLLYSDLPGLGCCHAKRKRTSKLDFTLMLTYEEVSRNYAGLYSCCILEYSLDSVAINKSYIASI